LKDHKGRVNSIRIKSNDEECVSASSDGSCIVWDLHTFKRRTSLYANTFFHAVVYHPDESQLVTAGTDRKVGGGSGPHSFPGTNASGTARLRAARFQLAGRRPALCARSAWPHLPSPCRCAADHVLGRVRRQRHPHH
jgi:hypothetical protein